MTAGGEPDSGIHIFPPLVFLAALVLAFAVNWIVPAGLGVPPAIRWPAGVLLIALSFAPAPSILGAFRRAGNEYDVRRVPKKLITEGFLAWSRNPGYVAMIVCCIGIALAFDNLWVFPFLVPAVAIVHYGVVLREEKVLESAFGSEYLTYKQRVRRWL